MVLIQRTGSEGKSRIDVKVSHHRILYSTMQDIIDPESRDEPRVRD